MALCSDLEVYKAISRFTKDSCKEYKYTVGESLKKINLNLTNETLTAVLQKRGVRASMNMKC
jgi:hypothetical protein